jgi:hypothetical protein
MYSPKWDSNPLALLVTQLQCSLCAVGECAFTDVPTSKAAFVYCIASDDQRRFLRSRANTPTHANTAHSVRSVAADPSSAVGILAVSRVAPTDALGRAVLTAGCLLACLQSSPFALAGPPAPLFPKISMSKRRVELAGMYHPPNFEP